MQSLSQRGTCHEQKQRGQTGRVELNVKPNTIRSTIRPGAIRSVGRFLTSLLKSVTRQRPNYNHSLSHLSEHQLRDIGFTRDSPDMKLPDINIGILQSGLHEHRRTQIRRLSKTE